MPHTMAGDLCPVSTTATSWANDTRQVTSEPSPLHLKNTSNKNTSLFKASQELQEILQGMGIVNFINGYTLY